MRNNAADAADGFTLLQTHVTLYSMGMDSVLYVQRIACGARCERLLAFSRLGLLDLDPHLVRSQKAWSERIVVARELGLGAFGDNDAIAGEALEERRLLGLDHGVVRPPTEEFGRDEALRGGGGCHARCQTGRRVGGWMNGGAQWDRTLSQDAMDSPPESV